MKAISKTVLVLSLLAVGSAQAFELTSNDIQEGHPMAKTFEYNAWGCDGGKSITTIDVERCPSWYQELCNHGI